MIASLIRKETRELLPLVGIAAIVQLYLVATAMHVRLGVEEQQNLVPFLGNSVISYVLVAAGVLAIAIGLRQTMWESAQGTFHYLLHMPVPRRGIFAVKLLVGIVACLLVAGLPLLAYALWAATPGTHASPFFWSMTVWAWQLCLQIPLLYVGAFLTGLRPARWYGSRALPLVTGAAIFIVVSAIELRSDWVNGVLVALARSVLAWAAMALAVLHVATTRDFS